MSIHYIISAYSPSTKQERRPETIRSLITKDEARADAASFVEKLKQDTGIADWEPRWETEEVANDHQ